MGQFFLVGVSTPQGAVVGAGAGALCCTRPQLPCRIRGLIADSETASSFELQDLRIGTSSRFLTHDPIPLSAYAVAHPLLNHYRRTGRLEELTLWDLGHVRAGQDVCVAVGNVTGQPAPLNLHLLCQATAEDGIRVRPDSGEGCVGCTLADTLVTLSPGLAWCFRCGSLVVEDAELRTRLLQAGASG